MCSPVPIYEMRMQNLRYVITLHGRCEPSHSFRIIKRAVNRVSRMMHREPFRVLLAGSCSRPGNDGLGICECVSTSRPWTPEPLFRMCSPRCLGASYEDVNVLEWLESVVLDGWNWRWRVARG